MMQSPPRHLIKTALIILSLALPVFAQDELPDAPQPARCESFTMDADGHIQSHKINCSDIPGQHENWKTVKATADKGPRFFTFRKSWQDPPLRTNKQMFQSKLYLASQIGGAIAMILACRNKNSGEEWGSEVPAVLAVDGLAYFGGRFFTQSFAVAPGAYQMIHYLKADTK